MTVDEELKHLRRLAYVQRELADRGFAHGKDVLYWFPLAEADVIAWMRAHGWAQSPLGRWTLATPDGKRWGVDPRDNLCAMAHAVADRMERDFADVLAEMLPATGPWNDAYAPRDGYRDAAMRLPLDGEPS